MYIPGPATALLCKAAADLHFNGLLLIKVMLLAFPHKFSVTLSCHLAVDKGGAGSKSYHFIVLAGKGKATICCPQACLLSFRISGYNLLDACLEALSL